jgi:hypothetical protein
MAKGPREFSWFIFRMTNPAMRELFMRPSNPFGVKSAVLSLLAGDIFGRTPFWPGLRLFKLHLLAGVAGPCAAQLAGLAHARALDRRHRRAAGRKRCWWTAMSRAWPRPGAAGPGCCGAARRPRADAPLWELGLGVAGLRLPHYRGAQESRSWLLPLPYAVYRGEVLRANRDGVKAMLLDSERIDFDISVSATAPTRSADEPVHAGACPT